MANRESLRLIERWNRYLVFVFDVWSGRRIDRHSGVLSPEHQLRLQIFRESLQLAVPVGIRDLTRKGGPDRWDYQWLDQNIEAIVSKTDGLVCGESSKQGLMGVICRAVSIMAFCPGGITLFGLTFEASMGGDRHE